MGLAPGSVVYTGLKNDRELKIDLIQYDSDSIKETEPKTTRDCLSAVDPAKVNWFIVNGLNHASEIESLGVQSKMTLLDIEDLVNIAQRPTLSIGDGYIKVILKLLHYDTGQELVSEHLSMVLFKESLIVFHESDDPVFVQKVIERGEVISKQQHC